MARLSLAKLETGMARASQLPVVVTHALRILGEQDPDFDELVRAISTDPALVARLISIANSPFMGRGIKVTNPRSACISLGFSALRSAILTVGIVRHLRAASGNSLVVSELWAHAFGTAAAARCLAPLSGAQPDMAYTAGLLHDIGKIVLAQIAWPDYQAVLAWQNTHDCFAIDAEREVLGIDHVQVGTRVATLWKLPDVLADAIAWHHTPEKARFPHIVDVVHIANVVARSLELGNAGDDLVPAIDPGVAARRRLTAACLAAQFTGIENAFSEILEFMD